MKKHTKGRQIAKQPKILSWRCDVLIHSRTWVPTGGFGTTYTSSRRKALEFCGDLAVETDTVADGDGGNVVALIHKNKHVGYGISDDAAAGAVLVRWVLSSVRPGQDTHAK